MEKLYTLISCAVTLSAMTMTAQSVEPDTVMSVNRPSRVLITENSSGMTVTVNGTAEDADFKASYTEDYPEDVLVKTHQTFHEPYLLRHKDESDFTVTMGGLMFGMVSASGAPEGMGVEMAKSYEIGLAEALTVGYASPDDTHSVRAGVGFTWRNYRTTLGSRYMSDESGTGIVVEPWPADVEGRFARIKIFSLTFPVLYEYKCPFRIPGSQTRLAFKGGVILNWNSHGSVKSAWTDADGRDITYTSNTIGQRKFTVDFMLAVKPMPFVGLYCKYSPMSVLCDGRGPSFKSLSAGLIFSF